MVWAETPGIPHKEHFQGLDTEGILYPVFKGKSEAQRGDGGHVRAPSTGSSPAHRFALRGHFLQL